MEVAINAIVTVKAVPITLLVPLVKTPMLILLLPKVVFVMMDATETLTQYVNYALVIAKPAQNIQLA